jgi:O-antigen/teichoic acid export membrane protein
MTILNAPLGLLSAFSASLQPGYGEAIGRGEKRWIAATVTQILKRSILLLGLLGVGFILLADPFIDWWTAGKLRVQSGMLLSVLVITSVATILTVLRYALTGINRHRTAALADLLAGLLALGFGFLAVTKMGPAWIGLGVAGAVLMTTAWILPRELLKALEGEKMRIEIGFWIRVVTTTVISLLAGWVFTSRFASLDGLLLILPAGTIITVTFSVLTSHLFPAEFRALKETVRSVLRPANKSAS